MTTVIFDKEKHEYRDNLGRVYISVTQLIKQNEPEFDILEVARKVVKMPNSKYYQMPVETVIEKWKDSAPIGTSLHEEIENYVNKKVISDKKEVKPCIEQFSKLKFKGKLKSEVLVFDEDYLIAGTVDLLEEMDDMIYLYDIKTCTSNKRGFLSQDKQEHFKLQLNLYKYLVEKQFKKPCIIVGIFWFKDYADLKENTKMQIIPIQDEAGCISKILEERKGQLFRV
jgi:hypothetical protein